jgi:hypothetical protein
MMNHSNDRIWRNRHLLLLTACFLVAMGLRVPLFLASSAPLRGDESDYYVLGVRLATGQGFTYVPFPGCPVPVPKCSGGHPSLDRALHDHGVPTARRTPGLPLLLAGIYLSGGDGYAPMRLVLILITSLTVPLLYCFCLLLFGRMSIALLAGLFWSVLPTGHRMAGLLYGESLAALLIVVGLILIVLSERLRSLLLAGSAGLALGYAALTRPYLLLAIVGPAAWLVVRKSRREAIVLLLLVSMILGGWGMRNFMRMDAFTLTTETDALWGGNNAWARGSMAGDWAPQEAYLSAKYPDFERLDETGRSRLYLREAVGEIVRHPGRILWLLPRKAVILFSPYSWLGFDWLYTMLLPFSVVGGVWLASQHEARNTLWLLGYPVFAVLIVCLVVYGEPRLRHPVDVLLVVSACVGLVQLPSLWAVKRRAAYQ